MRQLQGSDASFVARETPNSPMHIGSLLIYDPSTAPGGQVRFDDVLQFIKSRLQLSRTVRERLVRVPFDLDHPYWVEDENFDLEYHVRHLGLPRPGSWHQLCVQAARLFSRPLDLTRPPWELTLIDGLGEIEGIPPGCFAMVTKVHHAAIDGLSGIDLMEALHTLSPDAPPPQTRDPWRPEPVPPPGELVARSLLNAIQHPIQRAQAALKAAPGIVRIARGIIDREFSLGEMIGPKTLFNAPISPHRVVEGRRFALAEVKAIRRLAPGAWVNDVFLAIVGGAMRRYLKARAVLPGKPLTSLVPVSVRTREEKGSMGNQVAAMIVPIGTHLADPGERLRYVHDATQNSKAMTNAIGARTMSEISKSSPALFLAMGAQLNAGLGLGRQQSPPYSTLVTNVPGPRVPLYSAGARLHTMMGLMCLTPGLGLAHVVQTYRSEATISFTADRELMPDPVFYAECIEDSFAELLAAARARAKPGTRGGGEATPAVAASDAGRGDRLRKTAPEPAAPSKTEEDALPLPSAPAREKRPSSRAKRPGKQPLPQDREPEVKPSAGKAEAKSSAQPARPKAPARPPTRSAARRPRTAVPPRSRSRTKEKPPPPSER